MTENIQAQPKDKNGLTLEEFLDRYDDSRYPKPSVTADVVLFAEDGGHIYVLLIRRGGHPYISCLALPGGFADKNEPLIKTANRELEEETGVAGLDLKLVGIYSEPGRDPRGWVISAAYTAHVKKIGIAPKAADDAADARFFEVIKTKNGLSFKDNNGSETTSDRLAFDHGKIITDAYKLIFQHERQI